MAVASLRDEAAGLLDPEVGRLEPALQLDLYEDGLPVGRVDDVVLGSRGAAVGRAGHWFISRSLPASITLKVPPVTGTTR